MFKVGDRVKGQYGSTVYTGTVLKIKNALIEVKRDDRYGLPWECLIRPNGEVAGANGCDDGIHNLELISVAESASSTAPKKLMSKLNNMMGHLRSGIPRGLAWTPSGFGQARRQ